MMLFSDHVEVSWTKGQVNLVSTTVSTKSCVCIWMSTDVNIIPKYPSPQIQNKTLNKTGPVEVITAVSFVFWMKTELGT